MSIRSDANSEGDPTIVNPARLEPDRASQVCGQCHSIWDFDDAEDRIRRDDHGIPFRPGDDLHEAVTMIRFQDFPPRPVVREALAKNPDFLRERFWSDGMVRASGREYTAMIESPCFHPDATDRPRISCLSCHGMHRADDDPRPAKVWADDQLRAGMRSNDACLQCHAKYADAAVLTGHTHHAGDSTGSLCYNCHMPHTTFGLLKGIRSHQISVPTVEETLSTGRPNACNHCHLDQTLAWTADHLFERYGQPIPDMTAIERQTAASILWLVKGEAGQRALAAWLFGWNPARTVSGEDWMPPVLAQSLFDPYDAVRFIGAASLRKLEGFEALNYDFVGPAEHRTDTARRVIARWKTDQTGRRVAPEHRNRVLLESSGEFDFTRFEALYRQRDNRRIHIAE